MKSFQDCRAFISKRRISERRLELVGESTDAEVVHESSSPSAYCVGRQYELDKSNEKLTMKCVENPMNADERVTDSVSVKELKDMLRVYCVQDYLLPVEFGNCVSTLMGWGLKSPITLLGLDCIRLLGTEWRAGGQRQ